MLYTRARYGAIAAAVAAVLFLAACSPSLSPLYRDYEVRSDSSDVDRRIVMALESAGWDTVSTDVPNAIATDEKTLSNWGIYKVTASLEVTPLGQDHVRVFVHPYRRYITGSNSKIPYLTRRIRAKFLPSLNDALKEHNLVVVGTPIERDEE